jgi:hypothetical protein
MSNYACCLAFWEGLTLTMTAIKGYKVSCDSHVILGYIVLTF